MGGCHGWLELCTDLAFLLGEVTVFNILSNLESATYLSGHRTPSTSFLVAEGTTAAPNHMPNYSQSQRASGRVWCVPFALVSTLDSTLGVLVRLIGEPINSEITDSCLPHGIILTCPSQA